jgi:aryl sulfotransferase
VDSERWQRFAFRPDDIVISTPAKCGTTWMQTIIGMLVLDRIDLGAPISTISPWLDMLTYTDEETFRLLEEQRHRRFIKTHTPLDGVPRLTSVTYIPMVRHPLDVALSYRDHDENLDSERFVELRTAAAGPDDNENGSFGDALNVRTSERHPEDEPEAPDAYLRWWIDNHVEPKGNGPYGLADYCNQIRTYWDARADPNVHLFHYTDLWNDRESEMRRVAAALGVRVAEERWPAFVEAAGLDSMRSRAGDSVPESNVGLWRSPEQFFRVGGTRDWASLLDSRDITHFNERLGDLAGEASDWVLRGRVAMEEDSSYTG